MRINLLINIILLLLIGFIIGNERQSEHKIIGIRTVTLVMLGAFIFTYIANLIGDSPRMVAGIAGAVGFIGSGVIFKGEKIGNITTAVLILTLAGIGCLLALNFRFEAILFSFVTYIILCFYKKLSKNVET